MIRREIMKSLDKEMKTKVGNSGNGNLGNSNLPTESVVLVRKISDDTSGDNEELGQGDENKGTCR